MHLSRPDSTIFRGPISHHHRKRCATLSIASFLTSTVPDIVCEVTKVVADCFKADNPPPNPEIRPLRRCVASVLGALLALAIVCMYFIFIFYGTERLVKLSRALEDSPMCFIVFVLVVILVVSLLGLSIYWGRQHNDRAEYKLFISSTVLTIAFPGVMIVLLEYFNSVLN